MRASRIARFSQVVLILLAILAWSSPALRASAASATPADVPAIAKDNLFAGAKAKASTNLVGFGAEQAVDGLLRGSSGDNGLIFADTDPRQALSLNGHFGAIRGLRIFTNSADAGRNLNEVTIFSSLRTTNSLDPSDYDLKLFEGSPEFLDPAGDPPDRQIFSASIAVDAPAGTQSLLFLFGASTGQGSRVSEIQAFADAPKHAVVIGPRAVVRLADQHDAIAMLGWDTETGQRARVNLFQKDESLVLQSQRGGKWVTEHTGNRFDFKDAGSGGFDVTVKRSVGDDKKSDGNRLSFPFDPRVSAITIIPSKIDEAGAFLLPAIISAPGFGQMLVTAPDAEPWASELRGSRAGKRVDWFLHPPKDKSPANETFTLSFRPVRLAMPTGLTDEKRWAKVRRSWFNVFQVTAAWGDAGNPFSAPSGVLGNNVISDPVSCCLFVYADSALWTPQLAPGISAMERVGFTLDYWLDRRMLPTGEIPGYWNLLNFLDANPSILISAWDYFEATGDQSWLQARIGKLETAAAFLATRDVDGDGLLEAVQSGNAGTLVQPARSCSAYDAVNCGHKDAYSNALAYRAFRCLAELEHRLGRADQHDRYSILADRLKASYAKALLNPATGLISWWKSKDGALHDYAAPFVNGLAIEYGLVDPEQGRQILRKLRDLMNVAGFRRFDLGVPCSLIPVRRADYLLPEAPGLPKRDDGADTFGEYLNGGVITGDALRYLAALYTVGEPDDLKEADRILDAMLDRLGRGGVGNGGFAINVVDAYPLGGEFWTWEGKTCGYEGLLSHAYHFMQAVAVREPELRKRLHRPLDP